MLNRFLPPPKPRPPSPRVYTYTDMRTGYTIIVSRRGDRCLGEVLHYIQSMARGGKQ